MDELTQIEFISPDGEVQNRGIHATEPECFPTVDLYGEIIKWDELNQYAKETGDITFPLHLKRFRAWRASKNNDSTAPR